MCFSTIRFISIKEYDEVVFVYLQDAKQIKVKPFLTVPLAETASRRDKIACVRRLFRFIS